MTKADKIFHEASALSPIEKARLIDKLISDLDKSDSELNDLWEKEAEERIDAYEHKAEEDGHKTHPYNVVRCNRNVQIIFLWYIILIFIIASRSD